mmetsp:Transcript_27294/g.58155  ORF Transcript_27294/g.58155 Transcript_27294/m.58155 type:complete len:221 (-) Transcript_27294:89-751(-)
MHIERTDMPVLRDLHTCVQLSDDCGGNPFLLSPQHEQSLRRPMILLQRHRLSRLLQAHRGPPPRSHCPDVFQELVRGDFTNREPLVCRNSNRAENRILAELFTRDHQLGSVHDLTGPAQPRQIGDLVHKGRGHHKLGPLPLCGLQRPLRRHRQGFDLIELELSLEILRSIQLLPLYPNFLLLGWLPLELHSTPSRRQPRPRHCGVHGAVFPIPECLDLSR